LTKEKTGALFFLLFSIIYRILAFDIPDVPIAGLKILPPAAFPLTLSSVGIVTSLILLRTSGRHTRDSENLSENIKVQSLP